MSAFPTRRHWVQTPKAAATAAGPARTRSLARTSSGRGGSRTGCVPAGNGPEEVVERLHRCCKRAGVADCTSTGPDTWAAPRADAGWEPGTEGLWIAPFAASKMTILELAWRRSALGRRWTLDRRLFGMVVIGFGLEEKTTGRVMVMCQSALELLNARTRGAARLAVTPWRPNNLNGHRYRRNNMVRLPCWSGPPNQRKLPQRNVCRRFTEMFLLSENTLRRVVLPFEIVLSSART